MFFSYFQEVLDSPLLSVETTEIQLHKDGSWSIQSTEKKVVTKVDKIDESIEIISDDIGEAFSFVCFRGFVLTSFIFFCFAEVVTSSTSVASAEVTKSSEEPKKDKDKSVVDLTISDSEDDDEPLAKRKAVRNVASAPKQEAYKIYSGRWMIFLQFI